MLLSDFHFDLPKSLIAQVPTEARSGSRLLSIDKGSASHFGDHCFFYLPQLLSPGDLLIFNDTQVVPARLFGTKLTGGKVEVLVERVIDDARAWAYVRASKAPKVGGYIVLDCGIKLEIIQRKEERFLCYFHDERPVTEIMDHFGAIPLPPYIDRSSTEFDQSRYQTVYAKNKGAIAAPTAGLHFDEEMFKALHRKGIETAFITLHVQGGTFLPIRTNHIEQHKMHHEYVEVNQEVCDKINQTKERGHRVIAIGTTVVRTLEALARKNKIEPYRGDINLFITPGYTFKLIDGMLTNFHLPKSSLLILVCAFAGYTQIMSAYQHAIDLKYRFYSYGDAMLIL